MANLKGNVYNPRSHELEPIDLTIPLGITAYDIGPHKSVAVHYEGAGVEAIETVGKRTTRRVRLDNGKSATFTESAFAGRFKRGGRLTINTERALNWVPNG